ncbi:MAG: hypothetical protein HY908_37615 [Myxococcales bacterium]|nr:hypothetical protein [Myxococcales bacterium]
MSSLAEADLGALLLTLVATLGLALGWLVWLRRTGRADRPARWRTAATRSRRARRLDQALAGLALVACAPLLAALVEVGAGRPLLPGDAAAHARVSSEIALGGLGQGWIESYSGGFPLGPHYQPLARLVTAALVRAGLEAASATLLVGLGSLVLVPPLFVLVARRAGAAPGAALTGALLLAWVVPAYSYMGGPWVVLNDGLVSQAVATPLLLLTAAAVLGGLPAAAAPLLGACLAAAHAQLGVGAFLVSAPAVLTCAPPEARRRFGWACAGALVLGAALYGPGLVSFSLPFGWPKVPSFRVAGFPPEDVLAWLLEGRLLDVGRAPVTSALLWLGLVVLGLTWRSRASRGALLCFATALGVVLTGPLVASLGSVGARIVEVFSPVRVLSLVPLAAAAVVCVALTQVSARLASLGTGSPGRAWRALRPAELCAVAAVALVAGPAASRRLHGRVRSIAVAEAGRCRSSGWSGFDADSIRTRLRHEDAGRFVVYQGAPQTPCPVMAGVELESARPLGQGTAGPGSQVGLLFEAFRVLRADAAGGARRAEALGVRTLLHRRTTALEPPGAWHSVAAAEDAALSRRVGGRDDVGVGCVRAIWHGSRAALRRAMLDDLALGGAETLEPEALVRLAPSEGPLRRERVDPGPCRADATRVEIVSREAGHWVATTDGPAEAVVVLRATYVPWWRVRVDQAEAEPFLVAPGFVGVTVPGGAHRVEATVGSPPGYGVGLGAAGLALVGMASVAGGGLAALRRRRTRV